MFMDMKTWYCQDVSSSQFDLYIQWSSNLKRCPSSYFINVDKLILKFTWKGKTPRIANTINEGNKVRGLTSLNFKIYCRTTVIKTVWSLLVKEWPKQWDKIESTKVGLYKYSQLIFDKEQMQFGERIFFSTNGTGTTGHPRLKKKNNNKKKTRHNLTPFTKN